MALDVAGSSPVSHPDFDGSSMLWTSYFSLVIGLLEYPVRRNEANREREELHYVVFLPCASSLIDVEYNSVLATPKFAANWSN